MGGHGQRVFLALRLILRRSVWLSENLTYTVNRMSQSCHLQQRAACNL